MFLKLADFGSDLRGNFHEFKYEDVSSQTCHKSFIDHICIHTMGFSLFVHVIKHKRANNNHSDICILKAQKNHYMLPNDLYLHLKLIGFQADSLVSDQ